MTDENKTTDQSKEKDQEVKKEPTDKVEEIKIEKKEQTKDDIGHSSRKDRDDIEKEMDKITEEKEQKKVKEVKRKPKGKKKKIKAQVGIGNIYIKSSYNNTVVTATDQAGNAIAWSTAGICGFKGPKKATPYAAGVIVRRLAEKLKEFGFKDAHVLVRGIGSGRESAVRALNANGINILSIKDVTPIPHNGCKARKPRRV
jgi:small subunit ribosomal protein S11